MASVNIVNVTSILPFTINGAVTTSATDIIDVPADKLYKVNTIIIANIDGTNSATVTIAIIAASVAIAVIAAIAAIAGIAATPAIATIAAIAAIAAIAVIAVIVAIAAICIAFF